MNGAIVPFADSTSNIPDGWVLCDGNNGTPDMTDNYLRFASNEDNMGTTGGNFDFGDHGENDHFGGTGGYTDGETSVAGRDDYTFSDSSPTTAEPLFHTVVFIKQIE